MNLSDCIMFTADEHTATIVLIMSVNKAKK